MRRFRLSLIGAGRMGTGIAFQMEKLGTVDFAGVFDIRPDRSEAFAKRYRCEKICASREELLADKSVDAILICNYCPQHCETILAALDAGFTSVFCEKPAIRRPEEARLLREAVARTGARVMIGHHRKHIPACIKLKELIDTGTLGTIRFVKVNFCNNYYSRDWSDYFASYERSGGTTLDMVTHYVDLLNWFFGEAESTSARALMLERTVPADVDPVDYVNATLTYRNGVICGIDSSYQRYGEFCDRMEIYGDRYCAVTDFGDQLTLFGRGEKIVYDVPRAPVGSEQLQQARALLAMIEDGVQRQTTLEEGLAAAKVGLAMLESTEKGGELVRI